MTFYVLDILPAIAIIALIVSFVVKRRSMKREENELRETLQELQAGVAQENVDSQSFES